MTAVRALYALLVVVAAAAAVLSFAALRDLALVCGFSRGLAPLLPVAIDVGAAAGALAWLRPDAGEGRAFGRALALVLLATSIAGNALGHGLAAYAARPHWGVVVAVSAVAPAVLGAVVHLVALVARGGSAATPNSRLGVAVALDLDRPRPPAGEPPGEAGDERDAPVVTGEDIPPDIGRRRLARELGVTEHEARRLLAARRAPAGGDTA